MRYINLLFLLFSSCAIYSQDYGDYPLIEKDLLLRDLELLHQGLDKYHTGMYWYTSRDSVASAFEQAKQLINTDMNVLEFYKIVAPIISLSREDHTDIVLPSATRKQVRKEGKFLPLIVVFLGQELFVVKNGSDENTIKRGERIIKINGESINKIVDNLGKLLPTDGYIQSVKLNDLRRFSLSRLYYYYYGHVETFSLELEDGKQVELTPLSIERINDNLGSRYGKKQVGLASKESLEFRIINDSTAYLGLHDFSNSNISTNPINNKLAPFLERSFQEIAQKNIQHLIIDLARNTGGSEGNENLVYSYLGENYQKYERVRAKTQKAVLDNGIDPPITLKTFGFFERVFANKKMSDGSYERKKNIGFGLMAYKKVPKYKFNGSLYVLISPLTYSGGSELANMIYTNKLGSFIGQETGGGYYGNTSGYSQKLTLPHSEIEVIIPSLQFEMNVDGRIPFGRGVIPDYEVVPTFSEYEKGEDVMLNKALQLIENNDN